jgi:hypothetical protein
MKGIRREFMMRVFIALEQRFAEFNGNLYVQSISHYDFWKRYLHIFSEVVIIGRARKVEQAPDGWLQATGDRVGYHSVPYYQGIREFLRSAWQVWVEAGRAAREEGAFILRVP